MRMERLLSLALVILLVVSGFGIAVGTSSGANERTSVTSNGTIDIENDKYKLEDTVNITVSDADLTGSGRLDIDVDSDTETSGETITLTETSDSVFEGTVDISDTDSDGVLQVSDGDTITVYYEDADTGDGTSETKTDTAIVDGSVASLSNFTVEYSGVQNQTLLDENFDGGFPPTNWSQSGSNWAQSSSSNAGGTSPEANYHWTDSTGTWRLYGGPVDTTGMNSLDFQWDNYYDDYGDASDPVTIKIQTSSDGSTWNDAGWSHTSGNGNIAAGLQQTTIDTSDVGSDTFYVSFTVDGYDYDLNDWYVDNALLEFTNTAPDAPTNPSPADGATGVSTSPTLSVNVSDPDGDTMNVTFYDASDDSQIEQNTGVTNGTTSTTWSGLGEGTTYQWYVIANDSSLTNQSETWQFSTNTAPDAPTNPSPSDGATGVNTSPTLSVNVSDHDGDTMNVTFYNASDDSQIEQNTGVTNGTTSTTWSGLGEGTTYQWYVIANDSSLTNQSETWQFSTNTAPDAPTNPSPSDRTTDVSTSPTLSVDVSDHDGDSMDVTFYNASDDLVIGKNTGVTNGTTAVTWSSLSYSTTYNWYTVANDSQASTQSSTWSFTTQAEPNSAPVAPTNPSPADGATGVSTSPTLSVNVSDPDGDTMNVTFYDASDDSQIEQNTGVTNGTTSVTWSDLVEGTTYQWYVIANDSSLTNQSETWQFTTNTAPDAPMNPSPSDGATGVSTSPTLSVNVSDHDGDTMNVTFYNASDDLVIGTDENVPDGDTASITWDGLNGQTNYSWSAVATDSELETQSETWTFTTEDVTPPTVENTGPADGAENIDVNISITVHFSESMNEKSVEGNFSIFPQVHGTFSWNTDNTVLTYQLDEVMEYETNYQVTIWSEASDQNGVIMDSAYTFSFTTKEKPDDPPTVQIISPSGGEQYEVGTPMTINWTAVDDDPLPSEPVTVKVPYNGGTDWITLVSSAEKSGTHQWTPDNISTEVKVKIICEDSAGQTTEKTTESFSVVDTTPPDVEDTTPAENKTDVDEDQEIVIEFDEEVDSESVDGTVMADEEEAQGSWSLSDDNKTLTFTPSKELEHGTEYTVSVTVTDEHGNEANHSFTFTTSEGQDGPAEAIGDYWWIMAILVGVIVLGLIALFITRKKSEEEEEEYVPPEEDLGRPEEPVQGKEEGEYAEETSETSEEGVEGEEVG